MISENRVPFNVNWLAENFNFNSSDVASAEFFGGGYEVTFKGDKRDVAKLFSDTLSARGCNPRYFGGNVVWLNSYQEDKIIAAAQQANISPNRINMPNLSLLPQVCIEPDLTYNDEELSQILVKDYQLDLSQVKSISVEISCLHVNFKPNSLALNAFMGTLMATGYHPILWKDASEQLDQVIILGSGLDEIIARSKKASLFIPPIKDESEIRGRLKDGITLAKFFNGILPHVANVKKCDEEEEELNAREAYTTIPASSNLYRESWEKVESFLTKMKEYLPILKEILLNEEINKKIRYYFIGEKSGLIDGLEYFSKSEGSYLNLKNAMSIAFSKRG